VVVNSLAVSKAAPSAANAAPFVVTCNAQTPWETISDSDGEVGVIALEGAETARVEELGTLVDFMDLVESDGEGGGQDDDEHVEVVELPSPLPRALSSSERLCFFLRQDADLVPYLPPANLCALLLHEVPSGAPPADSDTGRGVCAGGEVAVLDIFLSRTTSPSFAAWAATSGSVL